MVSVLLDPDRHHVVTGGDKKLGQRLVSYYQKCVEDNAAQLRRNGLGESDSILVRALKPMFKH
jgi:hypothetical protein